MRRIISIHEYELKDDVSDAAFANAVQDAERRGLFDLPGLIGHYFLKGIKGERRGGYTAIWIFESRHAWEKLWGTPEAPCAPAEYPKTWTIWETDILAPLLTQHPDTIRFTSYEEV